LDFIKNNLKFPTKKIHILIYNVIDLRSNGWKDGKISFFAKKVPSQSIDCMRNTSKKSIKFKKT